METSTAATASKNKTSRLLWVSIGTLALGTLTFLGIKHLKKTKTEQEYDDTTHENETNPAMDFENNIKNHIKPSIHHAVSTGSHYASFPLKVGNKGDVILKLQHALIKSYGAGIFKKYGADGKFGNELANFLRSKGYTIPLSETDYRKITQEKKEVSTTTSNQEQVKALTAFNPTAIAYALYTAITSYDFLSTITLLKGIKTTSQYALASEAFKTYRLQGVRQTIVNALFNSFKTNNQRIVIQDALKKVGLKYDGEKWSI